MKVSSINLQQDFPADQLARTLDNINKYPVNLTYTKLPNKGVIQIQKLKKDYGGKKWHKYDFFIVIDFFEKTMFEVLSKYDEKFKLHRIEDYRIFHDNHLYYFYYDNENILTYKLLEREYSCIEELPCKDHSCTEDFCNCVRSCERAIPHDLQSNVVYGSSIGLTRDAIAAMQPRVVYSKYNYISATLRIENVDYSTLDEDTYQVIRARLKSAIAAHLSDSHQGNSDDFNSYCSHVRSNGELITEYMHLVKCVEVQRSVSIECDYCENIIAAEEPAHAVDWNDADHSIVSCTSCYFAENRKRILSKINDMSYRELCDLAQQLKERYLSSKIIKCITTKFWKQLRQVVISYLQLLDIEEELS